MTIAVEQGLHEPDGGYDESDGMSTEAFKEKVRLAIEQIDEMNAYVGEEISHDLEIAKIEAALKEVLEDDVQPLILSVLANI
ncbi:Oidioi.mRNA.OKI2018_I69.PAR.g8869.t1.cds [Oikopleura dioica]|uniref:Oidioi.mRNA.OKI2018_I69.PAR.g8869.t1.cds n=1 Tax=Oikopleura dioica TaxID=34765 RepID=A0ABN7RKM1_OIKDI|nr:Oidioi.mRNA.OKI2018_I69.PAR.g8869.t1.cds [Oikopleura dioica]